MQINSILINLPKRKDRLIHSEKELLKVLDSFNCFISQGFTCESTTIAIREAHKGCISFAKSNNFENILIIEDDICLRDNSKEYFNELLNNLPIDYDVCTFGIYSGKVIELENNKYWNKINKFAGLHFYIVNSKAYDKIIQYEGTQPIDHWIGMNLNCYISKLHFAYQLDGWSDNAKAFTNYNNTNLSGYRKYFLK
jgi:GR25 family glycosyltransferase involved in LPS biosynthesis